MAESYSPRRHVPARRTRFSGIDVVEAAEDNRPLLVGERDERRRLPSIQAPDRDGEAMNRLRRSGGPR